MIGAAVTDLAQTIEARPEMETRVAAELVPDWVDNRTEAIRARSAIHWPEKLSKSTPLLLLHGSADWRVSPKQTLDMADALYEARHPFRLVFFEGGDHGLSEYRAEVLEQALEFFDHYVRDEQPWPSLEPHGR